MTSWGHCTACRGDLCHSLGVGPKPLPLKGLSSKALASALPELQQPRYTAAALVVARRLASEDGVAAAVEGVLRTAAAGRRGQPFMPALRSQLGRLCAPPS